IRPSSGKNNQTQSVKEPFHTLTEKARLGLVTIRGEDYQIVDIGMRMLVPRELFRAQGFPEDYIIDPEFSKMTGEDFFDIAGIQVDLASRLTKTAQIKMVGNSVCPPVPEALVRANFGGADRAEEVA
ncbi:unnamed protein product, partial [marine sediment metagenome]